MIGWHNYNQDGSNYSVYAQRYASDGTVSNAEFLVNTYTSNGQHTSAVAFGEAGDFLTAWQSYGQDGSGWGIYGQLYGAGLADAELVPVKTTAPAGAFVGDRITVGAQIRNQGGVDAGSFDCQYYLSTDELIDTNGFALGDPFTVTSLDAYRSHSDSREFTLPPDTPTGDLFLGILVDTGGAVTEADETDNGTATVGFQPINVRVRDPLGAGFRVNTITGGDQYDPQVGANAAGNYVVVWRSSHVENDGTNHDVFFHRYNAEGTPLGLPQRVNSDWRGSQTNPDVAVADDGTFVVSWTTDDDGDSYGANARRFDVDGSPLTDVIPVNTFPTGEQSDSEVAINAATGDFVVVWRSQGQDGDGFGVYAQRFTSAGVADGDELVVNTQTTNDQSNPSVAMRDTADPGSRQFIVTWESNGQDGSGWGVYGQRFGIVAGAWEALDDEFPINTYTSSNQQSPSVAMGAGGSFIVAWHGNGQDGSSWGVFSQRYDSNGTPLEEEFRINTYTSSHQSGPAVGVNADGKFLVAWTSSGQDGSGYGLYAQRYESDGTPLGGEFQANTYTPYDQHGAAVVFGDGGNVMIAWQSHHQDGSGWGIYGRVFGQGPADADLVPVKVTAPDGANLGQTIDVSAEIRNQGGADAGSFTSQYYLSTDALITTADTPLGGLFTVDAVTPIRPIPIAARSRCRWTPRWASFMSEFCWT